MVQTLKPGLLVSLKTSIRGNVSYVQRDIEREHMDSDGSLKARWETERRIDDPTEFERSKVARGKARSLISAVCAQSAFGLLCPEERTIQLEEAIVEAREVARQFNESANVSNLSVYVITGRIARDDVEAVRAINSEIRELLSDMEQGVRNLDAEAIRTAANKARGIGAMLSTEAQAKVQRAIDAARSAARRIVKSGEQAATMIDQSTIRAITDSRTAFIDLDEPEAIGEPVAAEQGRAIDFDPAPVVLAAAAPQPAFDF